MDKEKTYDDLLLRLEGLIEGETFEMSVLANASALLRETMGERFFWVGFYVVNGEHLLLGPFQGSTACYRIARGRGVCGTAWQRRETIIVDDVETFAGHIACSSLSRSEIVVPLTDSQGNVRAVLDIDSTQLAAFDDVDRRRLEQGAAIIARAIYG